MEKLCKRCLKTKSVDEFYKKQYYCKVCNKEQAHLNRVKLATSKDYIEIENHTCRNCKVQKSIFT
jgi:hypothetical protein